MTFDLLVKESIQNIIDACVLVGGKCENCTSELRDFCCKSNKPIDLRAKENK